MMLEKEMDLNPPILFLIYPGGSKMWYLLNYLSIYLCLIDLSIYRRSSIYRTYSHPRFLASSSFSSSVYLCRRVQAVPKRGGGFELRVPLYTDWRGLNDEELIKSCGIEGSVFVRILSPSSPQIPNYYSSICFVF